jgi:putative Ca2+/H+ antiporter (TMEM165/GDT1 family)
VTLATVQTTLKASAALTAIVGDRVYQTVAPETSARPYVVWFIVSAVPDNTLSERPQRDDERIQIDCYSPSQSEATRMKDAVVEAVEAIGYIVFGPWNTYEAETKTFRWSLDLEYWNPR